MKITKIGKDYISIDERNINDEKLINLPRVHLIKFNFDEPTKEKVEKVLSLYPKTNRFVIDKDIRIYNYILKNTSKKYYIENSGGVGLITFFRRNNKVLLNTTKLSVLEHEFIFDSLKDVLRNIEVIVLRMIDYENNIEILRSWSGNVIIVVGNSEI